jgi:hypothetical protein
LDSHGTPFDSGYIFELGAFIPGFSPTSANTTQWAANWVTAARVAYDAKNRAFSGSRYIYSVNTSPFLTSNRGWIWGYRAGRSDEWILIGNPSWLWLDASSPFTLPVIWDVPTASQAVVGVLNVGGVQMRSASVNGASVPSLLFTEWRNLYFHSEEQNIPAISGIDADPDGDSISNSIEYLTGTPPRQHNALPISILGLAGVEMPKLTSRTGTLAAEISDNLITWQVGAAVQVTSLGGAIRLSPADSLGFQSMAFWRFRGIIP